MPTYSYACTDCDDRFDAVQAFSEDALTTCTKCEGRLRKLFNSVGVVFKGSGFYRTDSRDNGKNSSNGAETNSPSGSESGSSEKSSSSSEKSSGSNEKSSGSDKSSSSSSPAPAAASS